MIGFKTIDEFTFDDCIESIEKHNEEGTLVDADLQKRYDYLLSNLNDQEKRDYQSANDWLVGYLEKYSALLTATKYQPSAKTIDELEGYIKKYSAFLTATEYQSFAKTIDELEGYIKKYSALPTATKYQPLYMAKAKQVLSELKREAEQTRNRTKAKRLIKIRWSIIMALGIMVGIFFIGYKPVSYLDVSESSITFSKEAGTKVIKINSNSSDYSILYNKDWLNVHMDGDSATISVSRNYSDEKAGVIWIHAYPTFFGKRIEFLEKHFSIDVEQQDGHASFLDVASNDIEFHPEGGKRLVSIMTDGYEWNIDKDYPSWLSITKHTTYMEISANESRETYYRTASLRIYSDYKEKFINISQDYYKKEADIDKITWPECNSNETLKIRIDYSMQGYKDTELYVVIKIYQDKNDFIWYKKYTDIYESQVPFESYRKFEISPYQRYGRKGNNTIYACISENTDGSNPICSFEQGIYIDNFIEEW